MTKRELIVQNTALLAAHKDLIHSLSRSQKIQIAQMEIIRVIAINVDVTTLVDNFSPELDTPYVTHLCTTGNEITVTWRIN